MTGRRSLTGAFAALMLAACGAAPTSEMMPGADGGMNAFDAGAGSADAGPSDNGNADGGMTSAEPMYPDWELVDIQPRSPGFNTSYGLSAFAGRPVVVVLLEGF